VAQRVFRRRPILTGQGKIERRALAILLTGVAMIAVATVCDGLNAPVGKERGSPRVTIIYKNQVQPSIGELEAGADEKYNSGQANSDRELRFQRRGQWI
jgi:hypothetical protein